MKEIGKSRRKHKDNKVVELDLSLLHPRGLHGVTPASWWMGVRWTATDDLNLIANFNVKLNALEKDLIANIFSNGSQQQPLRDAWFSIGMTDEAAFMAVLSNSALHMDSRQYGGTKVAGETTTAVIYQTAAVALVNERLTTITQQDSIENLDAVIGAVSGLVCNADIRGSWLDWHTHLQGMNQLIKLRGGIDKLSGNTNLRLTVSWVEIQGALMFDISPIYPLPDQCYYPNGKPLGVRDAQDMVSMRAAWKSVFVRENDTRWLDIFEEINALSHQSFESPIPIAGRIQLDHGRETGAWSLLMIHGLLRLRLDPQILLPKYFRIQEACRLGTLLYMVRVWRYFGVAPVTSEAILAKLQAILYNDDGDWGRLWTFYLWILYMGAIEAQDGPLETWFLDRIASVSMLYGIEKWEESMAIVRKILWYACIFDANHATFQERIELRFKSCLQSPS
ncbi:hypothetical protein N0V93_005306 [Gnomoniopsis smithogilvyi]|uniref:Uncharacterized protein n=1 Tax=Gnomoniopsis smithogilvyi TaxID=1191159 RepID=A0A9W9CY08_9PEZI|nr:hypothetical protein N0V93_005306 [Gnomoniopsis smithogilvyi]